jgi:hypothetical protein
MKNQRIILFFFSALLLAIGTSSCSNDDESTARITVNEGPNGDIGGDFTGDGGSASRTISWRNDLQTADYNADITASTAGTFRMEVKDADGSSVLDRTLEGGREPDTFSGVTSAGTPGDWSVTITVSNFIGDGSYSLSAGD